MQTTGILGLIAVISAAFMFPPSAVSQTTPAPASLPPPNLGEAPTAPKGVSGLPGGGPRPLEVTGSFNVNTDSREQVREFYSAIYPSSEGVAMNSTAVTTNCFPGTNATAFQNATLRRINWLRAMGGVPAAITFNSNESTKDQAGALMMSANNTLQHNRHPAHVELFHYCRHQCRGQFKSRPGLRWRGRHHRLHLGLWREQLPRSATGAGFCIRKPS